MTLEDLNESLGITTDLWSGVQHKEATNIKKQVAALRTLVDKCGKSLAKKKTKDFEKQKARINKEAMTLLKDLKATDQKIKTKSRESLKDTVEYETAKALDIAFSAARDDTVSVIREIKEWLRSEEVAGANGGGGEDQRIADFVDDRVIAAGKIRDIFNQVDYFMVLFGKELKALKAVEYNNDYEREIANLPFEEDADKYENETLELFSFGISQNMKRLEKIRAGYDNLTKKIRRDVLDALCRRELDIDALAKNAGLTPDAAQQAKLLARPQTQAIKQQYAEIVKRLDGTPSVIKAAESRLQEYKIIEIAMKKSLNKRRAELKKENLTSDKEMKTAMHGINSNLDSIGEGIHGLAMINEKCRKYLALKSEGVVTASVIKEAMSRKSDPADALDDLVDKLGERRRKLELHRKKMHEFDQQAKLNYDIKKTSARIDMVSAILASPILAGAPIRAKIRQEIEAAIAKMKMTYKETQSLLAQLSKIIKSEDANIAESMKNVSKAQMDYEKIRKKK